MKLSLCIRTDRPTRPATPTARKVSGVHDVVRPLDNVLRAYVLDGEPTRIMSREEIERILEEDRRRRDEE